MSCPCPECNNDWGGECLYERIKKLEVLHLDYWDQNAVQCGNCEAKIITRGGSLPNNNGLSDDGGGEDEHLCGRCAGKQMYDYLENIGILEDANSTLGAALGEACAQVEESTHDMAAIATRNGWQSGLDHTCVVTHNAAAWGRWRKWKSLLGEEVAF